MKRMKKIVLACLLIFIMILTVACQTQSTGPAASEEATESVAAEPEESADTEETVSDDAVAQAKERTAMRTGSEAEWTGPTTGPAAATDKKIVCVNADSQNAVEAAWGESVKQACEKIGWEIAVLDGKGTVQGQIAAINQAISLNVDGIVTSANAEPLQAAFADAAAAGIPIVGIHASSVPGAVPDLGLAYNCTSKGSDIGNAMADYVIADSEGQGRAIILYDAQYAIAREKAEAMKAQLETCATVEVLDYVNSPLSEVAKNMPQLASSWISMYGTPLYVLSIADYYYDFVTPTLRSGGINPNDVQLVGSDGTDAAYDRIRAGDYQSVTVPEHSVLFGYMAVDELNRIFNGEEIELFVPDVLIVTADNIDADDPDLAFIDEYLKIWGK